MESVVGTGMTSTDLHLGKKETAIEDTGHKVAVHQETQHRTTGHLKYLYNAGYEQISVSDINRSNHDPFTSWNVRTPQTQREIVWDLRPFAVLSMLCNPLFGFAALMKAAKAREELERGNIARAKELNCTALKIVIGGIAVSFGLSVFIMALQMRNSSPPI